MKCSVGNNSSLNSRWRTFHNVAVVYIFLFFLLIFGGLFSRPKMAAALDTTGGSHLSSHICLDGLFAGTQPSPRLPLPPDPPPLALGCLIPGCELASSSPLELRVEIYGDAAESATVDFDAVSFDNLDSLVFNGKPLGNHDQLGRFNIRKGA